MAEHPVAVSEVQVGGCFNVDVGRAVLLCMCMDASLTRGGRGGLPLTIKGIRGGAWRLSQKHAPMVEESDGHLSHGVFVACDVPVAEEYTELGFNSLFLTEGQTFSRAIYESESRKFAHSTKYF